MVPSQYVNDDNPVLITGATSGVTAKVVGFTELQLNNHYSTLLIKSSGSDFETTSFADGENISANAGITHTTSYASNVASATTFTSPFTASLQPQSCHMENNTNWSIIEKVTLVTIESGVYYVRQSLC